LIRVLVSAKSAVTRAGLAALVRADDRFEVVGDADRDGDLTRALREHMPEVVLLDVVRPISSLPFHLRQPGAPAFVVCGDVLNRGEIRRLLQSGVRSIIQRDPSLPEIAAALEAAAAGFAVVSPEILDALLPAQSDAADLSCRLASRSLRARPRFFHFSPRAPATKRSLRDCTSLSTR